MCRVGGPIYLLAGDETISLTANEIPSTNAVLLGRKTIKKHNISTEFGIRDIFVFGIRDIVLDI